MARHYIQFTKVGREACAPANQNELFDEFAEHAFVDIASNGADVTIGNAADFDDPDNGGNHVHFLTQNGRVIGVSYEFNGRAETHMFAVPGELRWFPFGGAPDHWVPADGTGGSLDVQTANPGTYDPGGNGFIVLHQYLPT